MKGMEESVMLPEGCEVLELGVMRVIEGGAQVKVNRNMLKKSYCQEIASKYTKETGLSKNRIAKEIYAHAYMYYASSVGQVVDIIIAFPNPLVEIIGSAALQVALGWIKEHANPINIGGDSDLRLKVYNLIWEL